MISTSFPHHFARWGAVAAIVALGLAVFATAGTANSLNLLLFGDDSAKHHPHVSLDQEAIAGGIRLLLTDVTFSAEDTEFHIELEYPGAPVSVETFLPLESEQIVTENISGDKEAWGTSAFYPRAPDSHSLGMDLRLGPVISEDDDIRVRIESLMVQNDHGNYESVDGPWEFVVPANETAQVQVDSVIELNRTVEKNGVAIRLFEVQLSETGVAVYYAVPDIGDGRVMPTGNDLWLELPDGKVLYGNAIEPGIVPKADSALRFPPLPADVDSFTVMFGTFILDVNASVDVSFAIPAAFDSTALGEMVPVNQTVDIAGESVTIVGMMRQEVALAGEGAARQERISVEFVNAEADQQGSVLVAGPSTTTQLVDDQGRTYIEAGGHTGLRKDGSGNLTAGASGFEFVGPLADDAQWLTIQIDRIGQVITGPDPLVVELR